MNRELVLQACDLAESGKFDGFLTLQKKLIRDFSKDDVNVLKKNKVLCRQLDLICRSKRMDLDRAIVQADLAKAPA